MENDDLDLEYNIHFPPPITTVAVDENDEDDDESENVSYGRLTTEPVMILLGWLGCEDRHLSKYSHIYEKKGFVTIQYTSPVQLHMFKSSKSREVACKLLDLLFDYGLEESPVLFHIFSNNGSVMYGHVLDCIYSSDDRKYSILNLKGCIIDSAPGRPHIQRGAVAITMSLGLRPVIHWLAYYGLIVYLFFSHFCKYLLNSLKLIESNPHIYDIIKNDPSDWPQLYLYSRTDKVIMYTDIEEVIAHRRQMGRNVSSICWDGSEHVAHFRSHREAYIQQCCLFVDSCLMCDLDLDSLATDF